jgi:hypothetical protein
MSDREKVTIDTTIVVEWWYVVAALDMLIEDRHKDEIPIRWDRNDLPNGCRRERFIDGAPAGSITLTRHPDKPLLTTLAIRVGGDAPYWRALVKRLQGFGNEARERRREVMPTADDVIQRYYRIRAQGGKVTLRQLAEETGFNYSYLRDVKVTYDKAGRWGAKKRKPDAPDN